MKFQTLLLAALWIPLAHGQLGLGLTPMKLEFPAAAGRAYSGTLSLSNSSDAKVRVRTEILDFFVDQNQTPQFQPNAPSEEAFSCRKWITVNPMEGDVDAHGQLAARYTMRVPDGVNPGSHHCAIGFLSVPSAEESQGLGVRTAVRVVATMYPIVGAVPARGSIASLQLEPIQVGDQTQWRSVLTLENPGKMLYRPHGQVQIVDASGKIVETADLTSFPVLPERRQRFLLPLKTTFAPGQYKLRARVDLGHEIQEADVDVSLSPSR